MTVFLLFLLVFFREDGFRCRLQLLLMFIVLLVFRFGDEKSRLRRNRRLRLRRSVQRKLLRRKLWRRKLQVCSELPLVCLDGCTV